MLQLNNKNVLFFFSSTLVGGAETNILKISRELTKSNYKVFWCFLNDDGPLLKSVDFELAGILETGFFYKSPLKCYRSFSHFVKTNNIDIVFNFGLRVEVISRLISKRIGINRVVSNIRSTDDWRKWYHIMLDRLTQSNVDIWVSNSIAGQLIFNKREKVPLNKIKVIYNFFEPINKKAQTRDLNDVQVVYIGILANLTKEKGYWDLIPLAKELKKEKLNFKFIYAGYDKLNGEFQKAVKDSDLEENFCYLGYVSDKSFFFNEIDIFLLPSYLEGMPTVVLEAMAFKKPIVATNVGGTSEIILNGVNGYICEPGDIKAFTESIRNIIDKKHLIFIEANESRLHDFSKERIMKEWIDLIEG